MEKVIKKKGDKLYAKWKGCNNYINSWIDKKDMFIYMFFLSHLIILKTNKKNLN